MGFIRKKIKIARYIFNFKVHLARFFIKEFIYVIKIMSVFILGVCAGIVLTFIQTYSVLILMLITGKIGFNHVGLFLKWQRQLLSKAKFEAWENFRELHGYYMIKSKDMEKNIRMYHFKKMYIFLKKYG